jgi:multisubunit Na+/H+ antiporter MnhF subunit
MFVDIALALFLLNFVATLLVARYVNERRRERT